MNDDVFTRLRRAGLLGDRPIAVGDYRPTPTGAEGNRYAHAALRSECEAVATAPEGTRNHTLNKAAWKLGRLVQEGKLADQEVIDALTSAARAAGLTPDEIARTAPRAVHEGSGGGRSVYQPVTNNGYDHDHPAAYTLDESEPDALAEWVQANLPRIDWHELWADDSEQEWIVEPLIPVRRLVALYSPAKTGKSLLALELAAAVSAGRKVLGQEVQPRNVLYVDFENDPRDDIRTRLMAMGYEPGDLERLSYLSFPALAALDSDQGGQQLMAAVKHYEAEVVIIDTVSRAVDGEENENDTWLRAYRATWLRLKQAGVACLRLDHSGKDETKGQRGGSAKTGDVDAVWKLTVIDEFQLQLHCDIARMPVGEKDLILIRQELPHLHHEVDQSANASAFEAKVQTILAAFAQVELPHGAGRREARQVLMRTGVSGKNATIDEAVKRWKSIGATSYWDQTS